MDLIASIIGIAAVCLLLLYLIFGLDAEHFLLKLLLLFVFLVCLPLIPKLLIDNADHCELVPNTTLVLGELYEYDYQMASQDTGGLFLSGTLPQCIGVDEDLIMYMGVYDDVTGKRKTNVDTNCTLNLLDNQGKRAYVLNAGNITNPLNYIWAGTVPASFLNTTGTYTYMFYCNNVSLGGVISGKMQVTNSGSCLEQGIPNYTLICVESTTQIYNTLLGVTVWIWRFVITYMILFLGWHALKFMGVVIPNKKSRLGWRIR